MAEDLTNDLPLITEEDLREIELPADESVKMALEDFDRDLEKMSN